jgi:hypothetical protein
MISIRSLLREDDFDLSNNPLSFGHKGYRIRKNECYVFKDDYNGLTVSVEKGSSEKVAFSIFDREVEKNFQNIVKSYREDPDEFSLGDFPNESSFKVKIVSNKEYLVITPRDDPKDDNSVDYLVVGPGTDYEDEIANIVYRTSSGFEIGDITDYTLDKLFYYFDRPGGEIYDLPDDYFDERFREYVEKTKYD